MKEGGAKEQTMNELHSQNYMCTCHVVSLGPAGEDLAPDPCWK